MKRGEMTDGVFLTHIVAALKETMSFTEGRTLAEFLESPMLVRAVTASFEIAGEATKNLTAQFREAHPEVAWRDMAGFRDVLIHGYFGVDETQLWSGAKEFAPDAVAKIEKMPEYVAMRNREEHDGQPPAIG